MPLQCFQAMYWPGDGVLNGTPPANPGQYPAWQAAVVCGSLLLIAFGGAPVSMAAVMVIPRAWSQALYRRSVAWWRLVPVRVRLFIAVMRVIWSPAFATAMTSVKTVASGTLGNAREPNVWGPLGNRMGATPGVGENVWRHLQATEQYGPVPVRQRHARNLALELAFYGLKELT